MSGKFEATSAVTHTFTVDGGKTLKLADLLKVVQHMASITSDDADVYVRVRIGAARHGSVIKSITAVSNG